MLQFNAIVRHCPNLECAGMTALWNWSRRGGICQSGKRRHVATVQARALSIVRVNGEYIRYVPVDSAPLISQLHLPAFSHAREEINSPLLPYCSAEHTSENANFRRSKRNPWNHRLGPFAFAGCKPDTEQQ